MSTTTRTEPRLLRSLDEIVAAGAEAAKDFHLTDEQCEVLAACIADAVPPPARIARTSSTSSRRAAA